MEMVKFDRPGATGEEERRKAESSKLKPRR
jgi:hypothetical protein